jgi:DME family drug/metabolite transporter
MRVDGRIDIAFAGIFYGLVTVGASLLSKVGLSTLDISFFFLTISIIPLAPFVLQRNFARRVLSSSGFLVTYSIVNTLILITQFGSISLGLAPAVVALLLYSQPVWTVLLGRIIFHERIDLIRITVIAIALTGIVLVTDPLTAISSAGTNKFFAEILALLGGVFLSLWIILGKKGRTSNFKSPVELTFAVRATSCIPIGLISFGSLLFQKGLFLDNIGAVYSNIWGIILFAIFAGTIPDFLFYLGIERVQSLQAGIILLLEPVSAAVLSSIVLLNSLTVLQIGGGALILASNYLVIFDAKNRA